MNILTEIETDVSVALSTADKVGLPVLDSLEQFIPELRVIDPLLHALVPVLLKGVQIVQQASGASTTDAVQAVIDHNTPGAPNAPALS